MQRFITRIVFAVLTAYILCAVGVAVNVLYSPLQTALATGAAVDVRVLPAMIAIVGTALTAITTVYLAHRQGLADKDLAAFQTLLDRDLAEFQTSLSTELERFRQEAERALARRKVFLESERDACLELWGSASVFFNALLTAPSVPWPFAPMDEAIEQLVRGSRYSVFVDDRLRDLWFIVLQEATVIYEMANRETDDQARKTYLMEIVEKKVPDGRHSYSFRDRVDSLRKAAIESVRQETESA